MLAAVMPFAGAGVLLWARRRLVAITVTGLSMTPAYQDRDRVLVRRVPLGKVRTGDVVVVEQPPPRWSTRPGRAELVIKRVAGTPGEALPTEMKGSLPDDVVPGGCLVVLGDNPAESYDSRHFGYVPADRLVGLVVRELGRNPVKSGSSPVRGAIGHLR
ncbi:S26 family signal peptidase [Actinomadura fulvescens]|uniref:S26 family signal peptidase n=1 Tax=Actinomadura fulvescens TaxID=46160 RepID=A0ABN3QEX1_9ACTN